MLNTSTIYNEPIKILSVQSMGAEVSARAVPSPDSGAYMSNVMIMSDDGDESDGVFIVLDKDDAQELAGEIYHAFKDHTYSDSKWFKTTFITGVTTETVVVIKGSDECVLITFKDQCIKIANDVAREFCDYIIEACDQASAILQANKNLSKQMTKLKDDMKAELVHSLYFDILDEMPKMYSASKETEVLRIYEITARDKDDKDLYSFLRIMHLTGVPMIDYRDRGGEFLSCPFTYSDKLIEKGKNFVDRKKSGLHSYVDDKIANKKS